MCCGHLEYYYSQKLTEYLVQNPNAISVDFNRDLKKIEHFDPLFRLRGGGHMNKGYDEFIRQRLL